MEASEVLEDFWLKTQTVLALCDITQILFALGELADGKEVVLRDSHTTIQALQGLGSQILYPHQEYYVRAFESLLEWSVRRLQLGEPRDRDSLWMALAILDGPYGYNQRYAYAMQGSLLNGILTERFSIHRCRLITNEGMFDAYGVYYVPIPEERAFDRTVPRPQILVPTEKQRLQPLDVELDYVRDYLRSGEAKRILVTQSSFGWPLLSTRCVCIYVEADEMPGLIGLLSRQEAPVVVRSARFSSPAQDISRVKEIIEPAELTALERSKRLSMLRQNALPHEIFSQGSLHHGVSISLFGQESKGSIGVFLSPSGVEQQQETYALAAYHAVSAGLLNESRVITPGGLDISSHLYKKMKSQPPNNEIISQLLERRENPCGEVQFGGIGRNRNGWRTDFALVKLRNEWEGRNGKWHSNEELKDFCVSTENYEFGFHGTNGLVGAHDPMAGETCYKDGATTGLTRGRTGLTVAQIFEIATEGTPTEDPSGICETNLLVLHPMEHEEVCARGDSGSAIFAPVPEMEGWEWVGQLVSQMHVDNGDSVGLLVPPSQVFESLRQETGLSWEITR